MSGPTPHDSRPPGAAEPPPTSPGWAGIIALIGGALVAALPGFHLLELWMSRYPAMAISHSVGLALLVSAVLRWQARRVRRRAERVR